MENREKISADYFELRVLLNRTNLVRNQKTEVQFIIIKKTASDYSLMATLSGLTNPKFMELCEMSTEKYWMPSGYSGLIYLETFCAEFLQRNLGFKSSKDDINKVAQNLKTELQTLGIPR